MFKALLDAKRLDSVMQIVAMDMWFEYNQQEWWKIYLPTVKHYGKKSLSTSFSPPCWLTFSKKAEKST